MISKWEKLGSRTAEFWRNYMMVSSLTYSEKFFGCPIKERFTTREGMLMTHWMNPKAVWNASLIIENKLKSGNFTKKVSNFFDSASTHLIKFSNKIFTANLSELDDQELLNLYNKFCDTYKILFAPFQTAVYISSIEHRAKNWLETELRRRGQSDKFEDYYIRLTATKRLSLLQEEQLSLYKIALDAKRKRISKNSLHRLIQKHAEKYGGLPVINDETKPWNEKDFQKRVLEIWKNPRSFEEYENLVRHQKIISADQSIIFQELRAPKDIIVYFDFIQLCIWLRLACRNVFALSHFYSRKLFEEIGKRRRLSLADVKWLKPEETIELIKSGKLPSHEKIKDRERIAALLFRNRKYSIYEGSAAERIIAKELGHLKENKSKVIKGQAAYLGKVRGSAKVILSQKDIRKFKKGNILVARMTTPDLMPAVRLAKGIVTDEGGITCHAAIVSRELKIPCVVGTNFSTTLLNDGDLVEVDANKGVVRILKKA